MVDDRCWYYEAGHRLHDCFDHHALEAREPVSRRGGARHPAGDQPSFGGFGWGELHLLNGGERDGHRGTTCTNAGAVRAAPHVQTLTRSATVTANRWPERASVGHEESL